MNLTDPITTLKYVGEKTATLYEKKDIQKIADLWNFFPYRYEDTTKIKTISQILNNLSLMSAFNLNFKTKLVVKATLQKIDLVKLRRVTIIKAIIVDKTTNDKAYITWFNQKYLATTLKPGEEYIFYGEAKKRGSTFELIAPIYESTKKPLVHLGRLTPVYSKIGNLSAKYTRRLLTQIRPTYTQFKEYIPDTILTQNELYTISNAYLKIHFPLSKQEIQKAYLRLAIQELLELLSSSKKITHEKNSKFNLEFLNELLEFSPFKLTNDQLKALKKLIEFANQQQNNIFLYGDVGAGKTLVFYLLALLFLQKNLNVVLMAPTSVLATQHYNTLQEYKNYASNLDFDMQLITANNKKRTITGKKPTIYIGTHALLYRNYKANLPIGLITIDEQHRFGTNQKQQLLNVNKQIDSKMVPFTITMSATPIPRTLALTFYGYKKAIYIKQKPKGRKPIKTNLVPKDKINDMLLWIKQQVQNSDTQAYLVFPNIEGDYFEYGVKAWHEALSNSIFSDIPTGLVYGKLKESEKNKIMEKFKNKEIKILFSTTVIEVGIDVPNANIIAIFGADRFGLATLHQLRGRVGRGQKQAYCFVIGPSIPRLNYFTKHQDGIKLAEFDLKNRGPGDLSTGIVQAGWQRLKIASIDNFNTVKLATQIYQQLQRQKIPIKPYITQTNK